MDYKTRITSSGRYMEESRMNIQLEITSFCNYYCDYCRNYSVKLDHEVHIEKLEKFLNLVEPIPIPKTLVFIGGEPTLHYDCHNIVKLVCEKIRGEKDSIVFFTNGSAEIYYYKRIIQSIGDSKITNFMVSYHPSRVTDDSQFTRLIDFLADESSKSGLRVRICIMMEPEHFSRATYITYYVLRLEGIQNVSVELCPIEKMGIKYSDEYLELLRSTSHNTTLTSNEWDIFYNMEDGSSEFYTLDQTKTLGDHHHSFQGMMCHPLLHLKYDYMDEVTTRCPIWWHKRFKEDEWSNLLDHMNSGIICHRSRCGMDDDIMEVMKTTVK